MMSGKDIPLAMITTDTILDCKKQLNAKEGVDISKMILLLKDAGLQDHDIMKQVKVKAGSNTINLEEKEKVPISVLMMAGNVVALDMTGTDTILGAKREL